MKRSELRSLERRIRSQFHLTDKTYVDTPGWLEEMATGKDHSPRTRIASARVLLAMHLTNAEQDQEYIRADLVLEMWRGVLEAIRTHVKDQALVRLIVDDILRLLPAPRSVSAPLAIEARNQE